MIIPLMLPEFSPIAVFVVINMIVGKAAAFSALGTMLMGDIVTGLFCCRPRADPTCNRRRDAGK